MNLMEKRTALFTEQEGIIEKAKGEVRGFNDEERARYDAITKEVEGLDVVIAAEERAAALRAPVTPAIKLPVGEDRADEKKAAEERSNFFAFTAGKEYDTRAVTVTANGTLLPTSVYEKVMGGVKASPGILGARVHYIPAFAGTINIPIGNDTVVGHILNGNSANVDPTSLTNRGMTMYPYTSDVIVVDKKLLAGSPADVEGYFAELLVERITKAANAHMTTGDGNAKPFGAVTGATLGATAAAAAAVAYDDFVNLEGEVPAQFRKNGQWMVNDRTRKAMKKLKNTLNEPLWTAGSVALGTPETFMGYTVVINDDLADIGASAKSVLFGDFNRYFVAVSPNITIDTVVDQYKANGQIGLFVHAEYAGTLADAGNAIKYLAHPAS